MSVAWVWPAAAIFAGQPGIAPPPAKPDTPRSAAATEALRKSNEARLGAAKMMTIVHQIDRGETEAAIPILIRLIETPNVPVTERVLYQGQLARALGMERRFDEAIALHEAIIQTIELDEILPSEYRSRIRRASIQAQGLLHEGAGRLSRAMERYDALRALTDPAKGDPETVETWVTISRHAAILCRSLERNMESAWRMQEILDSPAAARLTTEEILNLKYMQAQSFSLASAGREAMRCYNAIWRDYQALPNRPVIDAGIHLAEQAFVPENCDRRFELVRAVSDKIAAIRSAKPRPPNAPTEEELAEAERELAVIVMDSSDCPNETRNPAPTPNHKAP